MKKFIFWPIFYISSLLIVTNFSLQAVAAPTIVGDDNRENITGKSSGREKAVVLIEVDLGDGRIEGCSGAMVGRNVVLTAAHCINQVKDNAQKVKVYAVGVHKPKNFLQYVPVTIRQRIEQQEQKKWIYDESGERLYPFATAKQLWIPNEYMQDYEVNRTYDYGLIILDYNLGDRTNWFGLKAVPKGKLDNANITVVGYCNKGYRKRNLCRARGRVGFSLVNHIVYDADVVHGSSGSPIFEAGNYENIIGLDTITFSNQYGPFYDDWVEDGNYPNAGLLIRQEIIDAVKAKTGR